LTQCAHIATKAETQAEVSWFLHIHTCACIQTRLASGVGVPRTHTQGGTHSRHRTHSMAMVPWQQLPKCKACIPDRVPIDTTSLMCSPRRVSQPLLPACPPLVFSHKQVSVGLDGRSPRRHLDTLRVACCLSLLLVERPRRQPDAPCCALVQWLCPTAP
jgi:hypothetical protein